MSGLVRPVRPTTWPWLAAGFAAAMLAGAHVFQRLGYAPCNLCLRQREVYWLLLAVFGAWTLAGLVRPRLRSPEASRLVTAMLAGLFAISAVVAAFHAGVEWKWWPGPESCSGAAGAVSLDALSGVISGERAVRAPACDEAAWIFLGLSMAGWNAVLSTVMAAASVVVIARSRPPA